MSTAGMPVPTEPRPLSDPGRTFIGVIVAICFLSGTTVALRVYGRIKEFRRLHIDDYAILLAWATCLTTVSLSCYWIATTGVGWPIKTIPAPQLLSFFKIFYGLQLLYVISVFVVKISILLLYIRIFDTPTFRCVAYSVMGICTAWFIASTAVAIDQCSPVRAAWDIALVAEGRGTCLDKQTIYWAVGISNLLLDVIILCLPLPAIWKLNLDDKKKIALCLIFLTGSIVCISSILRVTSIGIIQGSDFTKTIDQAALWSSVEANVAVIAACLPTLGNIFKRFKRRVSRSRSHATPTYDSERSDLTANPLDTNRSGKPRKVFDPYSTNVEIDKYEMGSKMVGWRSGTNEAYVEMRSAEGDDESTSTGIPPTPYENSNVFITTQVGSMETSQYRSGHR